MIFEDAHWADPTSLEAFGRVVDRIRTLGALLIVTYRPEFEPPWIGRPHVTALILNRLDEGQIAAIIDSLTGNKLLSPSVRQDIIERTDGIPLFVEEMTKAVLEAESESDARQTAAAVPSPALAVPASLHASLMARLDRLGPAKEVAQIGAAIGREFSHALLGAVAGKPGPELASALDRLIAAGLLFRQGLPPHATYLFKHALVQDAAYGTLLREPRRALHARIAETLESQFPDVAETQPEVLARHCTEAGLIEKAVGLWDKAGQRSLARSALVEATEQFMRALGYVAHLPATAALRRQQVRLQVALANCLMHVKGYAAPETKAAIEQARLFIERGEALGEPPEDPLLLFSTLYGVWATNFVAFNGHICRDLAAQFLRLAEKKNATALILVAHRIMGHSLVATGELNKARAYYDAGIALYNPDEHQPLATRFGQDVRVTILSWRSLALWLLGYPEAALRDADDAVKYGREIGQAASVMFALYMTAIVHILSGNYSLATAQARELVALGQEKGALLWKASGMMYEGCVLAATGRAAQAVEMLTTGNIAYRSTGSTVILSWMLSHLAKSYSELGKFDDAWLCIREVITTIETTNERWFQAEAHRIAGEIVLNSNEADVRKAETYFEQALTVAREQEAKSWELRAAMSLARLWRSQGKPQQARELLAPVYGWFTEGFDTRDLKEAKALLDVLT
jgi:predicted ATPase